MKGTRAALFVVAATLTACGGTPVRESFYTLSSPGTGAAAQSTGPSLFVGPVSVPESVDRQQMVLRTGANQVEISDQYLWAEPLKSAIPRVIAETLSRELGTPRVLTSRSGAALPVDYRVAVEIQRFDSSLDEGATVDALWTVTATKGGARRTGRTRVTEPVASHDPAALAAAHSRALDRVGRDIAAALR
ncbi:MAG TPA: PqiC family protein [Usitatibacter sp.]|nr:PqiC family protein [Usitatibacter sp.]